MADLFPAEGERVPFRVLAARAPKHDPASCTREPCSRCRPKAKPRVPPPIDHQVARHRLNPTNPWVPLAPLLRTMAKVMPADLAKQMTDLADAIRDHGQERWERLLAWEHLTPPGGISLVHTEPGDDDEEERDDTRPRTPTISLTEEQLRHLDHAAGRYAAEARVAAARLHAALAPIPAAAHTIKALVHQVRFHVAVAEARKNRRLLSREQTAAQVAADGWCRSCYRVGVFELIDKRPTGEPYYADLCRWCGSHRGDLEQPPIDLLRLHHRIPERKRKVS